MFNYCSWVPSPNISEISYQHETTLYKSYNSMFIYKNMYTHHQRKVCSLIFRFKLPTFAELDRQISPFAVSFRNLFSASSLVMSVTSKPLTPKMQSPGWTFPLRYAAPPLSTHPTKIPWSTPSLLYPTTVNPSVRSRPPLIWSVTNSVSKSSSLSMDSSLASSSSHLASFGSNPGSWIFSSWMASRSTVASSTNWPYIRLMLIVDVDNL